MKKIDKMPEHQTGWSRLVGLRYPRKMIIFEGFSEAGSALAADVGAPPKSDFPTPWWERDGHGMDFVAELAGRQARQLVLPSLAGWLI